MTLIDDDEGVLGKILHQCGRGLPRPPPRQVARIILDPLAVTHLLHHLDIEQRALLQPLGLEELVFRMQLIEADYQFLPDVRNGPLHVFPRRHVMAAGIYGDPAETA